MERINPPSIHNKQALADPFSRLWKVKSTMPFHCNSPSHEIGPGTQASGSWPHISLTQPSSCSGRPETEGRWHKRGGNTLGASFIFKVLFNASAFQSLIWPLRKVWDIWQPMKRRQKSYNIWAKQFEILMSLKEVSLQFVKDCHFVLNVLTIRLTCRVLNKAPC